jgi:drug/metabolite transporter (DMT)-like permease
MTASPGDPITTSAFDRTAPALFVLIWSTGFIVAKYGMPHAPPMSFLAWRYALSLAIFTVWIRWAGLKWPRERSAWVHLSVAGVLMHAGYLGGVWAAVKGGMSSGTSALIVGLQPILTALWTSWSGHDHRTTGRQWWGLGVGLVGLGLVVSRKLSFGEASWITLGYCVVALFSITVGTLYQKRHVKPTDVRLANAVQLLAALAVTLPLAALESEPISWNSQMIGALAWSVGVLTLGGSTLLVVLIQRGAATGVASLMYLVPPCTALLAWVLFGELLTPTVWMGMALTALGVWWVVRSPQVPAIKP